MVVALLLALCLPAAASAQIRTATPSEKKIILEETALGLKAEQDMRDLHAKAHIADAKGDEEAFVDLMDKAVAAESAMHEHLNRALTKIKVSYHVGPEVGAGDRTIANGPLQGSRRKYSPVFAPKGLGKVREAEADGASEKHYLRFEPDANTLGETWEDGTVIVLLKVFKDAQKAGNPGVVAAILQHEAVHFNDLVTTGWHTTEENERHAYEEGLKTAALFELDKTQIGFIERKKIEHSRTIWLNDHIPFGPALHSPFPNAAQEEQNRRDYEFEQTHKSEFELDREKLREIQETRQAAREAADKDHDERLRDTLVDLTNRSCANPGSVTQAELNGLPRPHHKYFYLMDTATERLPDGLNCPFAYLYLARGGMDAEEVAGLSTTPVAAQPIPQGPAVVPVRPTPPPPFSTVLPQFKEFAMKACRDPEQVQLYYYLYRPYDLSYREYDDHLAGDLSNGLADCPRNLLHELISTIRAGGYGRIDRQWIRDKVAAYSRSPDSSSGYTPPSGGGGRRRCEDYGNIRCP